MKMSQGGGEGKRRQMKCQRSAHKNQNCFFFAICMQLLFLSEQLVTKNDIKFISSNLIIAEAIALLQLQLYFVLFRNGIDF